MWLRYGIRFTPTTGFPPIPQEDTFKEAARSKVFGMICRPVGIAKLPPTDRHPLPLSDRPPPGQTVAKGTIRKGQCVGLAHYYYHHIPYNLAPSQPPDLVWLLLLKLCALFTHSTCLNFNSTAQIL
jgi:hypothetical protein